MTNKKFNVILILSLLMVFMLGAFFCSRQYVYAASAEEVQSVSENAENQPVEGEDVSGEQTDEPTSNGVSDSVKQYLMSVYGAEWETHYNQIIEQWGSIEKYLLSASENLPDEYKYKAQELIVNAGGYVPIIAYCLLILGAIAFTIYQWRKNKKVARDLDSVKAGQNQELEGELAIMDGLKALFTVLKELTPGERFSSSRASLESAETKINKASEVIKKDA
ncbi:MAG: hypothetical protein ACI4MN_06065 [Candidatus Coproplasma sp.]